MTYKKNLLLASLGHFIVDSCAGFFPIYLAMRDLDILKASTISTISNLIANFSQPFFGLLADKIRKEWLLISALLLAPVFMSMIGLTETYWERALLVILGKLFINLYHPAATDIATRAEKGTRSHLRFSIFITFGTVGYSLSALAFYHFCRHFGYSRSFILAIPGILFALLFIISKPKTAWAPRQSVFRGFLKILSLHLNYIIILFLLVVIRSAVQITLIFALPTLYKDWGFPETLWSVPHFLFVFSGAVSMIIFGLLEKRIAPVKLIFYSMLLIAPFSLLFLVSGAKGSLLSLFWVALLGFVLFSSLPANVVLGQKKMPEYAATISGILMGAAWGTASLSPLFISMLGESEFFSIKYGKLLPGTAIIGIVPVFGALLCLVLGREQKQPKL